MAKERQKERKRERERENSDRMRGLPRGGEESGGCGRRRVQIITIIIFPGNMAAERGWPRSLGRVGGKRGRGEAARQPGRVIIILQTTAAGMYLYNPSPSPSFTVVHHPSFSFLFLFPFPFCLSYSCQRVLPILILPNLLFHSASPVRRVYTHVYAYTRAS